MSISSKYFQVIVDYAGVEGDTNYIPVMKGDVVRLIKKDKEWLTVEKDGDIGKNVEQRCIIHGIHIIFFFNCIKSSRLLNSIELKIEEKIEKKKNEIFF
ncbi:MAG: hypothetical protein EZS28_017054 [Streblomastix strix]|uniref:SH3 domain-containing protein n=1 Tax=Streblomastix strix TaxID=222440 RepID=A0A5J4VYT2_9EUKA|nr:MAG: hypothetical protein EZS28_017054 [Streblomastix strix]